MSVSCFSASAPSPSLAPPHTRVLPSRFISHHTTTLLSLLMMTPDLLLQRQKVLRRVNLETRMSGTVWHGVGHTVWKESLGIGDVDLLAVWHVEPCKFPIKVLIRRSRQEERRGRAPTKRVCSFEEREQVSSSIPTRLDRIQRLSPRFLLGQ